MSERTWSLSPEFLHSLDDLKKKEEAAPENYNFILLTEALANFDDKIVRKIDIITNPDRQTLIRETIGGFELGLTEDDWTKAFQGASVHQYSVNSSMPSLLYLFKLTLRQKDFYFGLDKFGVMHVLPTLL